MKTQAQRVTVSPWSVILAIFIASFTCIGSAAKPMPRPAPEFTHQQKQSWLNSEPLALTDMLGKVLLIDFWTFDCWNCYRSFVWLHALESRLNNREFAVIGVHTPEFEHERHRGRLEDKVKLYDLRHPIMIDNDFSYWNAMGSRYWPTFFLIDKQGYIRAQYVGQTDTESDQAVAIEQMIETLLAE